MVNLVSVITPVKPSGAEFLGEAYASLRAQQMPSGWAWEWLVQEDGQTGDVAELLPHDERISAGTGRPGGPAIARNLALARSHGGW